MEQTLSPEPASPTVASRAAESLSQTGLDRTRDLSGDAPSAQPPKDDVGVLLSQAKALLNDPASPGVGDALSAILQTGDPATRDLLARANDGRRLVQADRDRFDQMLGERVVSVTGVASLFKELDGFGVRDLLSSLDGAEQNKLADAVNRSMHNGYPGQGVEPYASASDVALEIAEHGTARDIMLFGSDFASYDGPQRAALQFNNIVAILTSPEVKQRIVDNHLGDFRDFPESFGPIYGIALANVHRGDPARGAAAFSAAVDRMGVDTFHTLLENSLIYTTDRTGRPVAGDQATQGLLTMTRYYEGQPTAGVSASDWTARVQASTLLAADRVVERVEQTSSRPPAFIVTKMSELAASNATDIMGQLERQLDQKGRATTEMFTRMIGVGGEENVSRILAQAMTDNGTTTPLGLVERSDGGQSARTAGFVNAAVENAILAQNGDTRRFEVAKNLIQSFAAVAALTNPSMVIGVGAITVSGVTDQVASDLARKYTAELRGEQSANAESATAPFAPRLGNGDYAGGTWTGLYDGAYNRVRQ